jgi:hypothetical protein
MLQNENSEFQINKDFESGGGNIAGIIDEAHN